MAAAKPPPRPLFLRFAAVSGLGWPGDFASFAALVKLAGVPAPTANLFSSCVGLAFAWFASLNTVFRRGAGTQRWPPLHWGFQFASIMAYSRLLQLLAPPPP